MIKKQILEGRNIRSVESSLSELEKLIRESLVGSNQMQQFFNNPMDNRGMSMHSTNTINIYTYEVSCFGDNLIIDINNNKFAIAINEECNILIQRPQCESERCRIFFDDFKMFLTIS